MHYQENQYKAYGLMWEICAMAMNENIEARKDFEVGIYNNPLELMRAINQHELNYQELRYKMLVITGWNH